MLTCKFPTLEKIKKMTRFIGQFGSSVVLHAFGAIRPDR